MIYEYNIHEFKNNLFIDGKQYIKSIKISGKQNDTIITVETRDIGK